MKKIFTLILAAMMLISLAACTTKAPSEGDDYDKVLKSIGYTGKGDKTLTVAISPDFAPMEFMDLSRKGEDQYVGFDFLLSKYIAKELGMKVEFKPMSFDAVLAAVKTGNVDLGISGFSWTAERAENYIISDWYVAGDNESDQIVITVKEKEGTLTTVDDYSGLKVGAQGGSLQQLLVNEQLVPAGAEMQLYENLNDATTALLTGKIDALACAKGNGEAFIAANEGKLGKTGFQFEIEEKYKNNVILLNKENTELAEKVNAILADIRDNKKSEGWYEACKKLANLDTVDENGFDDNGNKITD